MPLSGPLTIKPPGVVIAEWTFGEMMKFGRPLVAKFGLVISPTSRRPQSRVSWVPIPPIFT